MESDENAEGVVIQEVLPRSGLVYSEKGSLEYVLCKPKIMPIKSVTLLKLEEMERKAKELGQVDVDEATISAFNKSTQADKREVDFSGAGKKDVQSHSSKSADVWTADAGSKQQQQPDVWRADD